MRDGLTSSSLRACLTELARFSVLIPCILAASLTNPPLNGQMATLLSNGVALVSGGITASGTTGAAELYW